MGLSLSPSHQARYLLHARWGVGWPVAAGPVGHGIVQKALLCPGPTWLAEAQVDNVRSSTLVSALQGSPRWQ